jgi:hypothetical protein
MWQMRQYPSCLDTIGKSTHTVVVGLEKGWPKMVKVSVEVHCATGRFVVAIKAQSIQQALNIVAARHPTSVARVKFPIDPESFFVKDLAA